MLSFNETAHVCGDVHGPKGLGCLAAQNSCVCLHSELPAFLSGTILIKKPLKKGFTQAARSARPGETCSHGRGEAFSLHFSSKNRAGEEIKTVILVKAEQAAQRILLETSAPFQDTPGNSCRFPGYSWKHLHASVTSTTVYDTQVSRPKRKEREAE